MKDIRYDCKLHNQRRLMCKANREFHPTKNLDYSHHIWQGLHLTSRNQQLEARMLDHQQKETLHLRMMLFLHHE